MSLDESRDRQSAGSAGDPPENSPFADDQEPLDAYSAAVVRVVETVGPAVVSVSTRARFRSGTGSGVVFTPDGYVLTNAHVVGSAKKVTIGLADGAEHDAKVIGTDVPTDLAVLRMEGRAATHAPFGRSAKLRVGQL